MSKKILIAAGFFCILFLPVIAISFWAYTIVHQVVLIVSGFGLGWMAYYISTLRDERERLSREVFMQAYELKKSKEALDSCLATDTETQFYNVRLLDSRLSEECDRARRYRRPLSFLLIEIDSFKDIEKTHGMTYAQAMIQEVATFFKENTRTVDVFIRQGENRFVSILPETGIDHARMVAERIRYAIDKNVFRTEGKSVKITVSVGFIGFDSAIHRNKDDVIELLERALSQAKKTGPNRIATLAAELS